MENPIVKILTKEFKPGEFQFLSPEKEEAGTMWLRVDNKTDELYNIVSAAGDPYALIPRKTETFIDKPVPVTPSALTGFPDYVRTAALSIKNKERTLLMLFLSRDGESGTFAAMLQFPSRYQKEPQADVIQFDPTKGKDYWVIQLTLKGENLVDSKFEAFSIQK